MWMTRRSSLPGCCLFPLGGTGSVRSAVSWRSSERGGKAVRTTRRSSLQFHRPAEHSAGRFVLWIEQTLGGEATWLLYVRHLPRCC